MTIWPGVLSGSDLGDLADDVRRVFVELDREGAGRPGVSGQCTPPLDVYETDEILEIVADLPGVPASAVRVLLKGNVVVVVGEKAPQAPGGSPGPGDYHLVERNFGRFARAVRLTTPFDGGRVEVELAGGELRVRLPRIHERRGAARVLPVNDAPGRRTGG